MFENKGKIGLAYMILGVVLGGVIYTAFQLKNLYHEKQIEIERLNTIVTRFKGEDRIAQVIVTDRSVDPETGEIITAIKFLENDRDQNTLQPRHFKIKGDVIYFDALVIKFDHDYIERGEALRGKSIALFRRVFGETQAPEDGFQIDEKMDQHGVPDIYRVDKTPSDLEKELWSDFWGYAANPEDAKKLGVRVIQGEAVYNRFIPDNIYTLTLDHDGGLNIKVEKIPPILRTKDQD